MTFRSSSSDVMDPAGMNVVVGLFSPGNCEPQTRQNHICQSCPGFLQVEISSSPLTQRKSSLLTTMTALPLVPVNRLQMEQWQTYTPAGVVSASYWIAPQLHSPVIIGEFGE